MSPVHLWAWVAHTLQEALPSEAVVLPKMNVNQRKGFES